MKQGVWRKDVEDFYLNDYRNIVKTSDRYELQKVYELVGDEILETEENKNNPNNNERTKDCQICVHHFGSGRNQYCLIRKELENLPSNCLVYCHFQNKCDAYTPIDALTIINSKEEMVDFICKTDNFFSCPEDYEYFYGFERNWDEETGDILETTMDYFDRGGKFTNIPDKYPCVIYFPYADLSNDSWDRTDFQWIYIGEDDETKI